MVVLITVLHYLQDESTTWEDDALDKGSIEKVFSVICHFYFWPCNRETSFLEGILHALYHVSVRV